MVLCRRKVKRARKARKKKIWLQTGRHTIVSLSLCVIQGYASSCYCVYCKHRTIEDLYTELVREGIIVKCPKTRLSEYVGEYRYIQCGLCAHTVQQVLLICNVDQFPGYYTAEIRDWAHAFSVWREETGDWALHSTHGSGSSLRHWHSEWPVPLACTCTVPCC